MKFCDFNRWNLAWTRLAHILNAFWRARGESVRELLAIRY